MTQRTLSISPYTYLASPNALKVHLSFKISSSTKTTRTLITLPIKHIFCLLEDPRSINIQSQMFHSSLSDTAIGWIAGQTPPHLISRARYVLTVDPYNGVSNKGDSAIPIICKSSSRRPS